MMDLPKECRPREKLRRCGDLRALPERELLCLLLGRGVAGRSVTQLAGDVESTLFPILPRTEPANLEELTRIKGMGFATASAVLAGIELGRRASMMRGRPIHEPVDAISHLLWMQSLAKEHFQALYLDTRRHLLASETISVGTLDSSLVHPREVFRPAVKLGASAVLVAHNHPSGDPSPSAEDLALTNRLDKAAKVLGFTLLDHLIVARRGFVSLRQQQLEGRVAIQLFAA